MLKVADRQCVLEGDGRGLRLPEAAEGGAAVLGQAFKIYGFGQGLDELGFADPGASGQH